MIKKIKPLFNVRVARQEDGRQIGQLIYDTVRMINRLDYTEEQVNVWAPDPFIYSTYQESDAYVAELEEKIVGFANLTSEGYLHRFYVHKDFQGQGIGSQLLKTLEAKAKERHIKEIYTEASITAQPFFLAKGYATQKKQLVTLRGMKFINYKMTKKMREA